MFFVFSTYRGLDLQTTLEPRRQNDSLMIPVTFRMPGDDVSTGDSLAELGRQ